MNNVHYVVEVVVNVVLEEVILLWDGMTLKGCLFLFSALDLLTPCIS